MKAIIYEQFGPPNVLLIAEVEKPAPGECEVLVKVHASSVTRYDCWVRSLTAPPGFKFLMRLASGRKPKQPILGTELSGTLEQIGAGVTRLMKGDAVIGFTAMDLGAHAEFICLPESAVAQKPANASFEEAAGFLQGALTALYFLRKANIQPGQEVLIFGASGGVGGYAVQLAKHYFGARVTGVCSTSKIDYVRILGADQVIDYKKQDVTKLNKKFNLIFDTFGKSRIPAVRHLLADDGFYLFSTFGLGKLIQMLWYGMLSSHTFVYGVLEETTQDIILLKELYEKGFIRSITDKVFPMEAAAQAHNYVETGQKTGNVIIQIQS